MEGRASSARARLSARMPVELLCLAKRLDATVKVPLPGRGARVRLSPRALLVGAPQQRRATTDACFPPELARHRHNTKSVPIPRPSILPALFRRPLFSPYRCGRITAHQITPHTIIQSVVHQPPVLLEVFNPVSCPKILILHVRAHSSPRTPMLCSDARVQNLIGSGKKYSQHHIDSQNHSPSTYVVHSKSHTPIPAALDHVLNHRF